MRILMLNNEFPPLGGGTGTVNQALLERFALVPDLSIDLVTSALGRRYEQERFSERITIHKVPVNNVDIHHSSNRELATYALRALPLALRLQRREPFGLCMAWSTVPAGGVAWAVSRWAGLAYIVRVSGPDIPGFEERYQRLYPLLTPGIRTFWRGAAQVVAKCREEADMVWRVAPDVDVTLVPNGVDLARFRPAVPRQIGEPLRLLCVGRLIERKGQDQLIRAVQRLRSEGVDVTLDLVGTGDAQNAYAALAAELGVTEWVRFHGYVPREQIADHYAAAHVFVLASQNEGMSVATLEAMAAGLPLIVTRTGGTAELVSDGMNGLTFAWADTETLVTHLRRLAIDRSLTRGMGDASRARAQDFSWDAVADQYLGIFDRLAHVKSIENPSLSV